MIVVPENIKKILASGIVLTIVLVLLSTAINGHFHKYNGIGLVYHAHASQTVPSDGRLPSGNSHSHNSGDLAFFDMLSNPVFLASVILLILAVLVFRLKPQHFIRDTRVINSNLFLTPSLRAPPAFVL